MQGQTFERLEEDKYAPDQELSNATTPIVKTGTFDRLSVPAQRHTIAILNVGDKPVALQKDSSGGLHMVAIKSDDRAFALLPDTAIVKALPFPAGQEPTFYNMDLGGIEVGRVASFAGPMKPAVTLHLREVGTDASIAVPISLEELLDLFLKTSEQPNDDDIDQANFFIMQPASYDELLCVALHDAEHPAFILIGPETNGHTDTRIGPKNVTTDFLQRLLKGILDNNMIAAEVDSIFTRALQDGLITANPTDVAAADPQHLQFLLDIYKVKCALLACTVQDSDDDKLHELMPWLRFYDQHKIFQKIRLLLGNPPKYILTTNLVKDLLSAQQPSLASKWNIKPTPAPTRPNPIPTPPPKRAPKPAQRPMPAPSIGQPLRPMTAREPISTTAELDTPKIDQARDIPSADFLHLLKSIEISEKSLTKEAILGHLENIIPATLRLFPFNVTDAEAPERYVNFIKSFELVSSFVERYLDLVKKEVLFNSTSKDVDLLKHASGIGVFGLQGHELMTAYSDSETAYANISNFVHSTAYACTKGFVGEARMNPKIAAQTCKSLFAASKERDWSGNRTYLIKKLADASIEKRYQNRKIPAVLIADVVHRSKLLLTVLAITRGFYSYELAEQAQNFRIVSAQLSAVIKFDDTVESRYTFG